MIFNSTEKRNLLLSIRKYDLIFNLFISAISFFTLCNLSNNGLDNNAFAGTEKEPPLVYDENLQITQLTEELNFPTGIDFLAEDDILVIKKNTGQVKRILDGKILNQFWM